VTSTERGRLDQEPFNASAAPPVHLKSHDNLIPRLPSSKYPPSRQRGAAAPLAPRYRTRGSLRALRPEIAAMVGGAWQRASICSKQHHALHAGAMVLRLVPGTPTVSNYKTYQQS